MYTWCLEAFAKWLRYASACWIMFCFPADFHIITSHVYHAKWELTTMTKAPEKYHIYRFRYKTWKISSMQLSSPFSLKYVLLPFLTVLPLIFLMFNQGCICFHCSEYPWNFEAWVWKLQFISNKTLGRSAGFHSTIKKPKLDISLWEMRTTYLFFQNSEGPGVVQCSNASFLD